MIFKNKVASRRATKIANRREKRGLSPRVFSSEPEKRTFAVPPFFRNLPTILYILEKIWDFFKKE